MNEDRALHAIDGGRLTAHDPRVQAEALLALLGRDPCGVWQDAAGGYEGERLAVVADDVVAHVKGDAALGIVASTDGRRGHWLAIDVDARWSDRWPCYASVLRRRRLAKSAIMTDGSRPEGSGKVVVFFEHALPLTDLRRLARDIDFEARSHASFGHVEKPSHVELWPKERGEGGVLRIGGRHRTRGLRVERIFDIDGNDADLRAVRPSRIYAIPSTDPKPIQKAGTHRFVVAWRSTGLPARFLNGGHPAINKCVMRLACEAYRLHAEAGDELLRRWLAEISAATPALASWSSPTTKDRRDPLAWGTSGAGAWKRVLESRGGASAATLPPSGLRRSNVAAEGAADRVVALLAQAVEARGLHPGAFEISYREIAGWLGEPDPKEAWRIVQRAVKAGKLRIVHRGAPGEKGLKTIFGLVESRITPSAAKARAERVLARREQSMIEHARAKWATAKADDIGPMERRKKRVALAREVHVPTPVAVVDGKVLAVSDAAIPSAFMVADGSEAIAPAKPRPSARSASSRAEKPPEVREPTTPAELLAYARDRVNAEAVRGQARRRARESAADMKPLPEVVG